jgi:hypothetical protein
MDVASRTNGKNTPQSRPAQERKFVTFRHAVVKKHYYYDQSTLQPIRGDFFLRETYFAALNGNDECAPIFIAAPESV